MTRSTITEPERRIEVRAEADVVVCGGGSAGAVAAIAAARNGARTIPSCMAMGQATGTAAALAAGSKTGVRELPIARLQEVLRSQEAII